MSSNCVHVRHVNMWVGSRVSVCVGVGYVNKVPSIPKALTIGQGRNHHHLALGVHCRVQGTNKVCLLSHCPMSSANGMLLLVNV